MELGGSFLFKGILDISGRKIITGEIYFYARPEGDQIPKGELGIKGGGLRPWKICLWAKKIKDKFLSIQKLERH